MLNRITDSMNVQSQALVLRAERQRILASNIANADTPGYQAREMNFSQALKEATGMDKPKAMQMLPTLRQTSAQHLPTLDLGREPTTLSYARPSQASLDNNSVDMDRERASFADNAVKYEATLRFLNGQVRTLTSAITGQ